MSDYISIQKVIDRINERARETFTLASGYEYYLGALHDVADDLRQMPTIDVVPVVRCKDCKWWKPIEGIKPLKFCTYVYGAEFARKEWDYCSRGERKDDE